MRDKHLLDIRPVLDLMTSDSTEIETFQNTTLRPILKFQNSLTAQLLASSSHFQNMVAKIDAEDAKAYSETLSKYVNSNIVFKNRMIGIITGLMTEEEFSYYLLNRSELTKRLVTMQIQRFSDNRNNSAIVGA